MVRVLERGLRAHGFEVASIHPGEEAVVLAADDAVGVVLLDVSSADFEPDVLVQRMRAARPKLPVIVLTARRAAEQTLSPASGGADDYLVKPFALEELIGRIRALTRNMKEPRVTVLAAGDLRLDLLGRCAWRGDRPIDLPSREFALLEYFMRHPGRVISRESIIVDVWGYDVGSAASNVVDVYVGYLRNRLDVPGEKSIIATVRGAGYRLNAPAIREGGSVAIGRPPGTRSLSSWG